MGAFVVNVGTGAADEREDDIDDGKKTMTTMTRIVVNMMKSRDVTSDSLVNSLWREQAALLDLLFVAFVERQTAVK